MSATRRCWKTNSNRRRGEDDLGAAGWAESFKPRVAAGRDHFRSSATPAIAAVSGESYLDLEKEALAMMKRD